MNHKKYKLYKGEITLGLLYDCRKIMADFIVREGDIFLPIFSRIQDEIQLKEKQQADKELALQIASSRYNADINLSP